MYFWVISNVVWPARCWILSTSSPRMAIQVRPVPRRSWKRRVLRTGRRLGRVGLGRRVGLHALAFDVRVNVRALRDVGATALADRESAFAPEPVEKATA
jgi:hypothetical protein